MIINVENVSECNYTIGDIYPDSSNKRLLKDVKIYNIKSYFDIGMPDYPLTFGIFEKKIYCSYNFHRGGNSFRDISSVNIGISDELQIVLEEGLNKYKQDIRDSKLNDLLQ